MAKERKNSRGATGVKSRRWRIILAALAVVLIAAAGVVSVWLVGCFLFSRNRHFILRKIEVSSTGWWNNRDNQVRELLELPSGEVNLFQLNLRDMRRIIEDHPGIRRAEVHRVLPDTMSVKIIERIPRAFINDSRSRWVADENGVIMDRSTCIPLDNNLPVILGVDSKLKLAPGMVLPEIQPVLNLIMLSLTEFTDMRISNVSVNNPGRLTLILHYRNHPVRYYVYMPTNRINTVEDIREMYHRLRTCITDALRTGNKRNVINLQFSGQAVMR